MYELGQVQWRATNTVVILDPKINKEWLRKQGFFSLEKGRLRRDLIVVFSYRRGSYKEDRTRLLSEVHSKEKEVIGTVATREIPISYKEKLFTYTNSSQFTHRDCEISILEDCHSSAGQGPDLTESWK